MHDDEDFDHEREHGRINERLDGHDRFQERAAKWGITLAGAVVTAIFMGIATIVAWLVLNALGVAT